MSELAFRSQRIEAPQARRTLRSMLLIRRLEEAMVDLYRRNRIPGFIHPGIGEEAVHVGVCDHLNERDHIIATHRGHGEALAKGVDPSAMMAEILGRADGVLEGRAGSLHVGDPSVGVLPASPLVGGGIATMTGIALAHLMNDDGSVGVCFFGDGALNRGAFHEAVNLASLWRLPIVYACIDNHWAISVQRERSTAGDYLSRAEGYGIPGAAVDGKDLFACLDAAGEAVERARAGGGPTLLFFNCPRAYGHEEGDAQHYRDPAEYEQARRRDPIALAVDLLTRDGILTADDVERLELEVAEVVRAAIEFGEQSPLPDGAAAFAHVRPSM